MKADDVKKFFEAVRVMRKQAARVPIDVYADGQAFYGAWCDARDLIDGVEESALAGVDTQEKRNIANVLVDDFLHSVERFAQQRGDAGRQIGHIPAVRILERLPAVRSAFASLERDVDDDATDFAAAVTALIDAVDAAKSAFGPWWFDLTPMRTLSFDGALWQKAMLPAFARIDAALERLSAFDETEPAIQPCPDCADEQSAVVFSPQVEGFCCYCRGCGLSGPARETTTAAILAFNGLSCSAA